MENKYKRIKMTSCYMVKIENTHTKTKFLTETKNYNIFYKKSIMKFHLSS